MSRILDFQDGFSSAAEPTQGLVTATSLRVFTNDAAFVTFKGSAAADGDMYKNSTDDTVRIFIGGAFQEMVDTTNAQTIAGVKTFSDNVIMSGDLNVNGTTTTINTTNLDVTDKNININDGGNDASSEGAGLNVERTGTDGSFVYEDALPTKFKLGALASEVEVVDVSTGQTFTNKTMAFGSNTFTGFPSGVDTQDEGGAIDTDVDIINFVGAGVTATGGGGTTTVTIPSGGGTTVEVAYVFDSKTSGTDGGTSSANTVHIRNINTEEDPDGIVSLPGSDRFRLVAGTYHIFAVVPTFGNSASQAFLFDVTAAAIVIDGTGGFTNGSSTTGQTLTIIGEVTPGETTDYEVRHWTAGAMATFGLGVAHASGTNNPTTAETYTRVKIIKFT